jgi:hypothetical protein
MGIRDELLEDVGVRYRAAALAKKCHILGVIEDPRFDGLTPKRGAIHVSA